MTTCLTRPATTFVSPKRKKSLSKTATKNFIQQRTLEQTSGTILFTLLLLYNAICSMSTKAVQFIKSYKIMYVKYMISFFFTGNSLNIYDEAFFQKQLTAESC